MGDTSYRTTFDYRTTFHTIEQCSMLHKM